MTAPEPLKVLVFSKTSAFRHECIPAGIRALQRLAEESQKSGSTCPSFVVENSEDATLFTPYNLAEYRVLVLLNVSGEFLNTLQLEALKTFVHSGGGVVGIHCASTGMPSQDPDSVDKDGWYSKMLGAFFTEHPEPQEGLIRVEDTVHPIVVRGLHGDGCGLQKMTESGEGNGKAFERKWFDEWYNFKDHPRTAHQVHVLLTVDEGSYHGGALGADHPLIWCQEFEGGRSFYTALGHFDEAYEEEMFMGQVLGGILWTAKLIG